MAHITVEDLSFTYPLGVSPALLNISLEVKEGELLLVIGPSGGGKSTLLRHFKSALAPHGERSGRVLINGRPIEDISAREQAAGIGFVFQHPDDQIVTDRVWHELAFGLESIGADRGTMRRKVAEMASYFGLEELFYKNTAELSGGQKQLLNLASVMALGPKLLILDEPTSQLDPIAAADFLATVKKINNELGVTVILSEHRLEDALPICDRVCVLTGGKMTVCAPKREAVKEIFRNDPVMALALPSAVRIALSNGETDEPPLTVNEGRRWLNSLGLKGRTLEAEAYRAPEAEPIVEAEGLFFRYEKDGADVLRGAELKLYPGEIYALVGGNGAGKSTLLSVLSGAELPYRGKLKLDGRKVRGKFSAFEQRIGYLRQDPRTLFSKDTVKEDLMEAALSRRREGAEERMAEAVRLFGIEELLERHPFDLSGGEQQRAAAAKVLLTEPKALLLDEPTKGMDAGVKLAFGEKLRELAKSGLAVLLVSHDTEFCAKYAHRAGFMFDGAVTSENGAREFFCSNVFYTTAANRIARDLFPNALLTEEVTELAGSGKRA